MKALLVMLALGAGKQAAVAGRVADVFRKAVLLDDVEAVIRLAAPGVVHLCDRGERHDEFARELRERAGWWYGALFDTREWVARIRKEGSLPAPSTASHRDLFQRHPKATPIVRDTGGGRFLVGWKDGSRMLAPAEAPMLIVRVAKKKGVVEELSLCEGASP